jgi:hypothetical protein
MKTDLKWGQTPWDDMTKEELLREVQRMYAALSNANSVMKMARYGNENSPFWGNEGTGGKALEMSRQILEPLDRYGEAIYRRFFRYAYDLLFDQTNFKIGFDWQVCPMCGVMLGSGHDEGRPCEMGKPGCTGIMRKLTWDDLKPDAWDHLGD